MNEVWDMNYPDSQKIVMLALADQSNDAGECWPSISTLARRCSKSERTIQAAIRDLENSGDLTRFNRAGTSCMYRLHPRSDRTPSKFTGVQPLGGEGCSRCTLTTNEPPLNLEKNIGRAKSKNHQIEKPDDISDQVWSDFITMRKRKKSDLTITAVNRIRTEATRAGWSMEEAIAECVTRGWQGFKADWVKPRDQNNGRSSTRQLAADLFNGGFAEHGGNDRTAFLLPDASQAGEHG